MDFSSPPWCWRPRASAPWRPRAVNIALGSDLSTIGLTIPAVMVICLITGQAVVLGLAQEFRSLLLLTLFVSLLTFGTGRTNVLVGAVHLVLFAAYLALIFML